MGVVFYNLFLWLYAAGIRVASLFHPKAKKWIAGRRRIFERLQAAIPDQSKIIWMHCASLGEFEQGRPLLEALRIQYPGHRILLTFFSPSGYEIRKNYSGADWVFYLPLDGPRNARRFLEIVQPQLVVFVKYEFWYYYLKKIKYRQIPLLLVSALFWEKMSFFRWYGAMPRKMLSRFDQLFVQDENSAQLMGQLGLSSITQISGDTRFDRVLAIAAQSELHPLLIPFVGGRKVIMAGSTWPEDEILLARVMAALPADKFVLVVAPHEISASHLATLEQSFPDSLRFSALQQGPWQPGASLPHCLIIDNIGMLSQLYRHAWVSYVGGGFGKGIHNILEAAVYGVPVMFGPVHHKFNEAKQLQLAGGAYCVESAEEALAHINRWLKSEQTYRAAADASGSYVSSHAGATKIILQYIQEKRLLIS